MCEMLRLQKIVACISLRIGHVHSKLAVTLIYVIECVPVPSCHTIVSLHTHLTLRHVLEYYNIIG